MIEELAVVSPAQRSAAAIGAEFPSVYVRFEQATSRDERTLLASEWQRDDFDTWAFDVSIDEQAREPFTLRIADDGTSATFALEVLNRCQRHIERRNRHSQGQLFTRVLRRHRALHDLEKPLVRADYNHALDVRQWLLRLDPDASLALQLAALFHDVERLVSEADVRVEHLAADYQSFKDAHAARGAEMALAALAEAGVDASVRTRVAELIAKHERPTDDPGVALLNDADALSFFSLNSHGYASYFGPEQTKKKVAYTWNRMRSGARAKLSTVRLRADVREMVNELASAVAR
ncbi:MAG TPA: DUF4202 family protein [Thermoanaerobaculia bacterium]|nr:DUF4202 family protein [Thermoanaerobaculia bacterium]